MRDFNPANVRSGSIWLPSHDGLKSCDVRCWFDSCQKIAGPRMQRSANTRHSFNREEGLPLLPAARIA